MKKFTKILFPAVFVGLGIAGACGVEGAARLFSFIAFFKFIIIAYSVFLCIVIEIKDPENKVKFDLSQINQRTAIFENVLGFSLAALACWHGWIWTATALSLSEIGHLFIIEVAKNREKKEENS